MLAPIVILFFAIYVAIAIRLFRKRAGEQKKLSLMWMLLCGLLLFFGDHAAGYIFTRLAPSLLEVPLKANLSTKSIAIDQLSIDRSRRSLQNSGAPPIFNAFSIVVDPNRLLSRYEPEDVEWFMQLSTGLSIVEVVKRDSAAQSYLQTNSIDKYYLSSLGDPNCKVFDAQTPQLRKNFYENLSKHSTPNPLSLCAAKMNVSEFTSDLIYVESGIKYWYLWLWFIGVSLNGFEIVNVKKNVVEFARIHVEFSGGWVYQFLRFSPDTDYIIRRESITTAIEKNECCKHEWSTAVHILPF